MNKDIIKGNWNILKGKIHQQWGKLTDDEIAKMEGNQQELNGILQKKYGYAKDKAEKEINEFLDKNDIKYEEEE